MSSPSPLATEPLSENRAGSPPLIVDTPLVVSTVESWRPRLLAALGAQPGLALDLAACADVDVFGLQLLLSARRSAQQQGKGFQLLRLPPAFERARERTGCAPDAFAPLAPCLP